jgi:hypothetical protein
MQKKLRGLIYPLLLLPKSRLMGKKVKCFSSISPKPGMMGKKGN